MCFPNKLKARAVHNKQAKRTFVRAIITNEPVQEYRWSGTRVAKVEDGNESGMGLGVRHMVF